jgi:C_GCAxxG_C_C family probable redox protein
LNSDELIRAVGPFGGGMGLGEVCGALSGALATLGLRLGRAREEERESRLMWGLVREVADRFRQIGGGTIYCRDLVGVDWANPEEARAYYRSDKVLTCLRVVGETARMLAEILDRIDRETKSVL